ncbi:hypothetical protein SCLCIDRAFT_19650 [Scleroderma citrinum Foug A]|uniref:Uncharacterized protein n=1 Tax=Scleroderma citrinum Foug A TaxID=1036808 RepID=A0A0C3E876_9AGAM|nr:hypothetical protein SCLCIDRAFT_19650 [Scleroderma citrinum Foug A]
MNQPTSSCYRSLTEEISGLINPGSSAEDFFNRETYPTAQDIDIPDADYLQDDVDMPPADDTFPPLPDHNDPPPPDHNDPFLPFDNSIGGECRQLPGTARFVETYQGNDQYAEQQRQNIYFPWASRQEWAFALWLLRSRLSMAVIDSLLSLEIVSSDFQGVSSLTAL